MEDGFKIVSSQEESTYDDNMPTSLATEDENYQIGEHIAENFSDGFYVGEILEKIDDSKYRVSYMSPKVVSTADYNEHKKRYWYWPSKKRSLTQTRHIYFKFETSNFDCYSSTN